MSWEATAYVKKLSECPDGAALDAGMKLLLFVLADYHNTELRRAFPSVKTLARESLIHYDTAKRYLHYLESHLVIEQHHPENQGSGQMCWYSILELDAPERLAACLHRLAKGVQAAPLFSTPKRGAEGVQEEAKRGAEGVQEESSYPLGGTGNYKTTYNGPRQGRELLPAGHSRDTVSEMTTQQLKFIVDHWKRTGRGEPTKIIAELKRRKAVN